MYTLSLWHFASKIMRAKHEAKASNTLVPSKYSLHIHFDTSWEGGEDLAVRLQSAIQVSSSTWTFQDTPASLQLHIKDVVIWTRSSFRQTFSRQRRFWKVRKISCTLSHSHSPFFHMRILPSASSLHSKQQLRLSVCKLLFPSCDFKKVILNHLQSHWNNNFFRSLTVILSVPFHTVSYVEQVHLYRWQREFN